MKRFQLSPAAIRDIREIWRYIAGDSPRAAGRVRASLLAACQRIADNPRIGHPREDLTSGRVLFWPSGSYLIVYRPESDPLDIIRVLHGARDLANLS